MITESKLGSSKPTAGGEETIFPSDRKTILLLGSGALKIGEAGEFDYSGSQAIKAYQEEGYRIVLVNPNIATYQTSWGLADRVYFVPVQPDYVERIAEVEKPDFIALSFGGQTALNCGVELNDLGILKKHKIKVLGTPVESIRKTEDRALFNQELRTIDVSVPKSHACETVKEALKAAEDIGYPVIVRGAFALGGKGSGCAKKESELEKLAQNAFVESPQILVEEDLTGWKEIEYEVVRDNQDNCITVCNMENIDPLGIHTGESIVIAPSQTLDNYDYQMLRSIATKVIRHLGIVGECNIQYALDPHSRDYRVIEVNARLSRSSALASKATGYPLAFVAAKLGLDFSLPDISNAITQVTCSDFEPALDYVALKVPRWDLQKFRFVSDQVTSEMKSVGEVMALGRSFEEALQKALRMLNIGADGMFDHPFTFKDLDEEISRPTPRRIFAVAAALKKGWSSTKINEICGIDKWFLDGMGRAAKAYQAMAKTKLKDISAADFKTAKQLGFSDRTIGKLTASEKEEVRARRLELGVAPVVKQIDTLAGEFPAQTNYLYLTYHGTKSDIDPLPPNDKLVVGLGGGPYSIGSSVEFDWCCVQATKEMQRQGYQVAMINSNPETVSTDYDECDHLFFDELTEERVRDICDVTNPEGVIVSMGGQIPNSLAPALAEAGLQILGTHPSNIDRAEDRNKFSSLLDELEIDQPEWKEFTNLDSAIKFAAKVKYPVIVRPSYVLSGASMATVHSQKDLEDYVTSSAFVNKETPIVISKFEANAKEIEFDGVAQNGNLVIYAISEHVENAGVHSGDATMVMPPQRVNLETMRQVKRIAKSIAQALEISGPFNIQILAKNNQLKVIECNLRASRSFPFASKVTGENFITLATQALIGKADETKRYQTIDLEHVAVKAAQFSFSRLKGADPRLGIEMASTGEVACFGHNAEQALLNALTAVGFKAPEAAKGKEAGKILLTIGNLEDKMDLLPTVETLHDLGYKFFATKNTHEFLESRNVPSALLHKISESRTPNIKEYLENKRVDLVINIPTHSTSTERTDGYTIRRTAIDQGIPLITNVQLAKRIVEALAQEDLKSLPIMAWPELLTAR